MHDDQTGQRKDPALVDRRRVLRVALGLVAGPTLGGMLAGCGSQSTGGGSTSTVATPLAPRGTAITSGTSTAASPAATAASATAAPAVNSTKAAFDAGTGRLVYNTLPHLEESPIHALKTIYTPNNLFFIRDHFIDAKLDGATFRLRVHGEVNRELNLSVDDLRRMPSKKLPVVIECAGNMRGNFKPKTEGTQWGNGAASNGEWTGVPLKAVLDQAGLNPGVIEIVCEGGDNGHVIRELPLEKAIDGDTLVAYQLNGEDIPVANGYPVRLIVPGWVGVANIKWLSRLEARKTPFDSYYNTRHYVFTVPNKPNHEPYTVNRVKSIIIQPAKDATVGSGKLQVEGLAWSGAGTIARVELSTDQGKTWNTVQLVEPRQRWGWTRWQYTIDKPTPGKLSLSTRATDDAGNTQPQTVEWNRNGYGYNAIQTIDITVS
ncbi:MAG: hypothetical protein NVS4B8_18100 [Herpetosiphon sp.]